MDRAGQTEKNKIVRKENFISSLKIHYSVRFLKCKGNGSRQPAVTVTRHTTGEPLARGRQVQNRGPRATPPTPPTRRPASQAERTDPATAALVQARRGHSHGGAEGAGCHGDP